LCLAALIYLPALFSPHLTDDTDAVQAQIPRNMLRSGDWVTARLDGVAFLEKSPMLYWMVAVSYSLFGYHDWAAKVPIGITVLLLGWLVLRMGQWAFGLKAGIYSALTISTCVGLFLFTRILIPDVVVTGTIAFALWAMLRALDEHEPNPARWAHGMAAAIGVGVLLKGVIGLLFPVGAGFLFLALTNQLFLQRTWKRLRPLSGVALILLITAPWFVLATIRNPPYFDFTMSSGPGQYRGFFWFYFFNEHILRFLNERWPRDYDTVPRYLFWLLHWVWLFPWSAYLPALLRLSYRGNDRASQMRLLCLSWAGFILLFFTFSTTQEYYSLPTYPALALLIGCAMAEDSAWIRRGARVIATVASGALLTIAAILINVWDLPTPGDISNALTQHPEMYTLSLGHMGDLTLASFAYLRGPLGLAGLAFLVGAIAAWRWRGFLTHAGLAIMMVLFLNAARQAMSVFDPYLSSQTLAEALNDSPPGTVILGDQYYVFSSIFYYADLEKAYLLNGRYQNLEYGSYAPGAPNVFAADSDLDTLWKAKDRAYLVLEGPKVPHAEEILGKASMTLVKASGGKYLFTNHPLDGSRRGGML
jgi:4-amino-4-deoxy-L-arabinose transferase-like glycosyltransferase